MRLRIRTERVIDCPKHKRVVPLRPLAARADKNQLTCEHCPLYEKGSCYYVTCNYQG